MNLSDHADLRDLLERLFRDELSDAQQQRLQTLANASSESRDFYARYMQIHAGLQWHFRDQPVEEQALQFQDGHATPTLAILRLATSAINRPVYWSILAATLLFAGYFVAISWNMLGTREAKDQWPQAQGNSLSEPVATIRNIANAEWTSPSGQSDIRDPKSEIAPGEPLAITSGQVELKLKQGATIVVEGPAQWSIDDKNNATLNQGKLFAKVPGSAMGFTLETPTARIVDLGTEFNVEVKKNRVTTVDVTRGKVRVSPVRHAGHPPRQPVLLTPQAGRLVIDPHTGAVTVAEVPQEDRSDLVAREKLLDAHRATESHRSQLLSDPALLAHYSFDLPTLPPLIKNKAPRANGRFNLEVHGCTIAEGSRREQHAIAFRAREDWLATNIPGEFDALTMIGIVKFSKPRPQYAGLVMTDLWETPGQLHWQITPEGELQLAILGVAGAHDKYSQWIVDRDRWLITAVAADTRKQSLTFYVDGSLISEQELKLDTPLRLGPLRIGNWRTPSGFTSDRYLNGSMEELAIFSRALTGEEIRRFTP